MCLVNYALLLHCSHFPHSAFYRYVGLWRHCSSSGNMWNDSCHVVWRIDQSASFRTFDSAFYFPHSAIPHFTHYQRPQICSIFFLFFASTPLRELTSALFSLPFGKTNSCLVPQDKLLVKPVGRTGGEWNGVGKRGRGGTNGEKKGEPGRSHNLNFICSPVIWSVLVLLLQLFHCDICTRTHPSAHTTP